MTPLELTNFTATSCLGAGLTATLAALESAHSGLAPCHFETVQLKPYIGEVAELDPVRLPQSLQQFDCRNNRLAQHALMQDGFDAAVHAAVERLGAAPVGVFPAPRPSGLLTSEIAYRHLDPLTGALPGGFNYRGSHNSFSVADFVGRRFGLAGPAGTVCTACSSSGKGLAAAQGMVAAGT